MQSETKEHEPAQDDQVVIKQTQCSMINDNSKVRKNPSIRKMLKHIYYVKN